MSRLLRVTIILVLLTTITLALQVAPVAADSCPDPGPGNYYNVGRTRGYNMYGGHARATEQNYFASDWAYGGFVDQTLWVGSGAESNPYWAEIGFGHGWQRQNIMYFYYARVNPSTPYNEFKLSKTPGGAGTWHTYEILVGSNGYFTSKIDGTTWATTGGFDTYSQRVTFGGEETNSASTMPDTPGIELYYMTSTGLWSQWSSDPSLTICRSMDPYQWAWSAFPNSGHFWK